MPQPLEEKKYIAHSKQNIQALVQMKGIHCFIIQSFSTNCNQRRQPTKGGGEINREHKHTRALKNETIM